MSITQTQYRVRYDHGMGGEDDVLARSAEEALEIGIEQVRDAATDFGPGTVAIDVFVDGDDTGDMPVVQGEVIL